MQKGNYISKEESILLHAIAVMLMVFHHLFAFPERIHVNYTMLFDFSFLHIETMLSYFGRICIGMFAFISGYGMSKVAYRKVYKQKYSILKGYFLSLYQLKKFYIIFWSVCVVFIPLGFVLNAYRFDWLDFVKSLLGISTVYNGEWWYISDYLRFLVCFPILFYLFSLLNRFSKKVRLFCIFLISISLLVLYISFPMLKSASVSMCFVFGIIALESDAFERAYTFLLKLKAFRYGFSFIAIILIILIRIVLKLNCDYDFIFVPFLIFFILVFLKGRIFKRLINPVLKSIGKYSTYIWLTHTFFAYYYFQYFTYFPYISTFIFLWCLTLTIITGFTLDRGRSFIEKGIRKNKGKRKDESNTT